MAAPYTDCSLTVMVWAYVGGRQVHETSSDSTGGNQPTNTHSQWSTASKSQLTTQSTLWSSADIISLFWDGDEVIVHSGCSFCTCSGVVFFLTNIHCLLLGDFDVCFLLCMTFSAELAFSSGLYLNLVKQ